MMNKLATIVALSALTCTTTATEAESAGGETAATKVEVSGYGGVYILDVARSIDENVEIACTRDVDAFYTLDAF